MVTTNDVKKLVRDSAPSDDAHLQTLADLGVIHELSGRRSFPSADDTQPYGDFMAALDSYIEFYEKSDEDPLRRTLGVNRAVSRGVKSALNGHRRDAQPDMYLRRGKSQLEAAQQELEALINYAYHVDGQSLASISEQTSKGRSTIADIVKKRTHVGPVLLAREEASSDE